MDFERLNYTPLRMKRLFIYTVSGLLLVNLLGLLVVLPGLYKFQKEVKMLIATNESLRARTEVYEASIRMLDALREQRPLNLEELDARLTECYRCHSSGLIIERINRFRDEIASIQAQKKPEIARSFVSGLVGFAEMSLEKAKLSAMTLSARLSSFLNYLRTIFVFAIMFSLGAFLLFSFYSLGKVKALEKEIGQKQQIITDWAMDWQDTFNTVKDMLIILDRECRPIVFNTFAAEFFKEALLRDDFCKTFLGITCDDYSSRILRLKNRWFDLRIYPSVQRERCILAFRDITEERELQEKLARLERLASIGTMAGGIAHEINNPLTPVVGYSEILLQMETDEKKKDYLKQIHLSGKRIQNIVRDLLIFGRKKELRYEKVMLEDLIEEVFDEYRGVKDIKINKDFRGAGLVNIDRGLFGLVLNNIINNAIDAIRDSGKGDTIELRTFRQNDTVKLEISDNGPGIPEEILPRIFDPFFTTKEVGKGSGLGLSIAHNVVTALKGDISVRSGPQEGTTFIISLPSAPSS